MMESHGLEGIREEREIEREGECMWTNDGAELVALIGHDVNFFKKIG